MTFCFWSVVRLSLFTTVTFTAFPSPLTVAPSAKVLYKIPFVPTCIDAPAVRMEVASIPLPSTEDVPDTSKPSTTLAPETVTPPFRAERSAVSSNPLRDINTFSTELSSATVSVFMPPYTFTPPRVKCNGSLLSTF